MPYFAKLQPSDNPSLFHISNVIRIDKESIDSGLWGEPNSWIETSYNTYGNIYYTPNSDPITQDPNQALALRANYANIGYTYDQTNDVFYSPQPYPSWTLNTSTWLWEAPVQMPTESGRYKWDESTKSWLNITNNI